jgi:hypothetical protein
MGRSDLRGKGRRGLAAPQPRPYTSSVYRPSPSFRQAAADYLWLLDRGYSRQAALKLVGDRRQLPRDERMILYRGIASSDESAARRAAIAGPAEAAGRELLVDGYNQALTALHYAAGRPVFVGSDGLARDAGGSHGRIPDLEAFSKAVSRIAAAAASLRCPRALILLDSPVPGSASHARIFAEAFVARGIEAESRLERSADAPLKAASGPVLVASGDSAIADAVASRRSEPAGPRLFDLARAALELAFPQLELLVLSELLAEESEPRSG